MQRLLVNSKKGFAKTVTAIRAREVLDSRGFPTVEAEVQTKNGLFRSIVPSGASTGIFEALELRDIENSKRYKGKGVLEAVSNVNTIIGPALLGSKFEITDQSGIDKFMVETLDGSKNEWGWNKNKLGANSILAVSMAIARAAAAEKKIPLYQHLSDLAGNQALNQSDFKLPIPFFNVINGGKHAGNLLPHQEFMIAPVGAKNFREAVQMGSDVYHTLKSIIKNKYGAQDTSVGDEGGFAPSVKDEGEALELIFQAIKQAGYEGRIKIALDVAASELWDEKKQKYNLDFKDTKRADPRLITGQELLDRYVNVSAKYPIISIEDPFDQQDWENWSKITAKLGSGIQIVGDDLLVTNPSRIQMAIDQKACNALLLKVNQIGTVTESIEACKLAQKKGWGVMVSHRSGETEDTFIADLVVALRAGQIKTGAPCRGERTAKYNQLMRIEDELGDKARFTGKLL
jgi:enolase